MTKNLAGTNIPPGNGGVTFPSPNEWPFTYVAITNIRNGLTTLVTAPNHGIISSDLPQVQFDFSQVKGMQEINGKFAYVVEVVDINNLLFALDSTTFSPYLSGGYLNLLQWISAPIDPFTNTFA
jgi:ubiquitin-activating enzyme E1-like protein